MIVLKFKHNPIKGVLTDPFHNVSVMELESKIFAANYEKGWYAEQFADL